MNDQPAPHFTVRQSRERTVQALIQHFAEDRLDLPEFEARLDRANRADSVDELQRLTADLPALSTPAAAVAGAAAAPAARRAAVPARPDEPIHKRMVIAVMSGVSRKGAWKPPRRLFGYAFWGGIELDFREAQLQPGVTEVMVLAIMGGADIIVPPDLPVECTGFGLMGGFDHEETEAAPADDAQQPRLRIKGFALMGGVDINVRLPGESSRDAAKRRKQERAAKRLAHQERRRLR
jgi:hypothetical protein